MFSIGDREAVDLIRFFDDLPDPRSSVNRLHRLGDVIVIAICAVVARADGDRRVGAAERALVAKTPGFATRHGAAKTRFGAC